MHARQQARQNSKTFNSETENNCYNKTLMQNGHFKIILDLLKLRALFINLIYLFIKFVSLNNFGICLSVQMISQAFESGKNTQNILHREDMREKR